jgi:5,10-methylenetetrahydromethanopterin reductase
VTSTSRRLGFVLGSSQAPEEIVPLAQRGEALGLDEIWVAEDYFYTAGFSTATAILAATEGIRVGTGVVSAMVRHPAVLAMEVATVDRLFPGRFVAGLGYGLPAWVRQMGASVRSPLGALRQRVDVLRELLAGNEVSVDTPDLVLDRVALTHPCAPPGPPIWLGVSGAKMSALSREIADGTLLSILAGEAYLRWLQGRHAEVVAEATAAGRSVPTDHELACFSLLSVGPDREAARAAAREYIATIICRRPDNPLIQNSRSRDVITDLAPRGRDYVAAHLPDDCLDEYMLAGTPEECAQRATALYDAGAASVVLFPIATTATPQSQAGLEAVIGLLGAR